MIAGFIFTLGLGTIVGVIWWIKQKPTYAVMIVSAAGESPAFSSPDKNQIFQIVNAVNEAIIARG